MITEVKERVDERSEEHRDADRECGNRQGTVAARLSAPAREKLALLDELVGVASATSLTAEEARAERLSGQ